MSLTQFPEVLPTSADFGIYDTMDGSSQALWGDPMGYTDEQWQTLLGDQCYTDGPSQTLSGDPPITRPQQPAFSGYIGSLFASTP
jgi:hypothetical protein